MKISIIVPVYNVELYLERCVNSLINQTYKNLEIILVDDGSPDKCGEICDAFSAKDERVHTIHKENGGLSSARNKGIENATGDYILFVDSDDFISKTCCESFSQYFNDDADILIGDCETKNEGYAVAHYSTLEKNKIMGGKQYLYEALLAEYFPVPVWLNMYKKVFLTKHNLKFKDGILHEDIEFTPRAFWNATKVQYTGIKFYNYITNEFSITSREDKTKNCVDIYDTCESLTRMLKDENNLRLNKLLNDYLCNTYLGIYRSGNMYLKDSKYIHKRYVLHNSYRLRTKFKSILFCVSPKLFCKIGK